MPYEITPQVNATREFIEIAKDFSNPLDLTREAISNAFDAGASNIIIDFSTININGEVELKVTIEDDGCGMGHEELKSFFDLGNSTKINGQDTIGEKGHGTKVYFNCKKLEVTTTKDNLQLNAIMNTPFNELNQGRLPVVSVKETPVEDGKSGTKIEIIGYNNNRRANFTHEKLKDYILWFTKFGSPELKFGVNTHINAKLRLKGLDRLEAEIISFGHMFPEQNNNVDKLFEMYEISAPDYYCKHFIYNGSLSNAPEITYQAIFSVEGNRVKYDNNPMIKRRGYQAPIGSYTVQERYGVWLCKDFIPVQRKNEWITYKGSEYTKFHAFFNCQGLKLTANRGSVDNTPNEILSDIEHEVRRIFQEIIESGDWENINYLEDEANAYRTIEKEQRDFVRRTEKAGRQNVAIYKEHELTEPDSEVGTYALFLKLSILNEELFPFCVVDYNTHEGIDVIVMGKSNIPIHQNKMFYVEFKHYLKGAFNHSFKNLHSIICWDTSIKNDDLVTDLANEQRKMSITAPENGDEQTLYFLDHPRSPHRIQVFVLKDYLKQMLKLEFRPRAN